MTSGERRAWTIAYSIAVPAAVLVIDLTFYVAMRGWTYNVKDHEAAAFWPIVLSFGAVCFPLAAGGLAKAIFEMWSARASMRWRVTEGRVTGSTIEIHEHAQKAWIGWDSVEEYLPKVTYAYEVAGSIYNSDLASFALAPFETREEAERLLRGYPKGAPVRVRYDPEDPSTSVLRSTGSWAVSAMGVALSLAIIPFTMAFMIVPRY